MIRKLLLRFHDILKTKSVKLYWIPIHLGVRQNKKVDALTKQLLNFQKIDSFLPACDFRPAISKLVSSE
jgi:ribonuclease HI